MSEDWSRELATLRAANVALDPGLNELELGAAERRLGVAIPPDLRSFLAAAHPMGKGFPNWRELDSPVFQDSLGWPFEGLRFDIERNGFWWPAWGERPSSLSVAFEVAHRFVERAPRLIPVYSHRYLPAEPNMAGNPVFSVYQTDIIYYGRDLRKYLQHEFANVGYVESITPEPRDVRFWSDLVGRNNARTS